MIATRGTIDGRGGLRWGMADPSVEIKLSGKRGNPADTLVEAFAGAARGIDAAVYKFDLRKVFIALEKALDRGVAVRLVVDKWLIDGEKDGFIRKLATRKNAATIRKWTGAKLHAKLVIIDDRRVLSGSYNWTRSVETKNTELLLRFDDPASVERFARLFDELWKNAEAP